MTDVLKIEALDVDGAIREAHEDLGGDTRSDFFKKAALGGGAALGSGVFLAGLPDLALGQKSNAQDVKILNYALLLEFLENDFYVKARRQANLRGDARRAFRVIQRHEAIHVRTLRSVLKGKARQKPRFDFGNATNNQRSALALAQVLEDTGVTAYLGQATRIKQPAVLAAAGTIVTIEARHAAFIRELNGNSFAPRAFDRPVRGSAIKRAITPFLA